MYVQLNSLQVYLQTNDREIEESLQFLFHDWPTPLESTQFKNSKYNDLFSVKADFRLSLTLVDQLSERASNLGLTLVDEIYNLPGNAVEVKVFKGKRDLWFYLSEGAIIRIFDYDRYVPSDHVVRVEITKRFLSSGRLEDVFFMSIAPLLRRRGYFLIHAFAATLKGKATLIVGPSGSGKTTSGLSLVMAGWGYLANDVLLLKEGEAEIVFALPTPGGIALTKQTMRLLPDLTSTWTDLAADMSKIHWPVTKIVAGWARPAQVNAILFPIVGDETRCRLESLSKAAAVARLMESSIDRWDVDFMPEHITFLEKLCRQADCFVLHLGQDVSRLSELISATL